MRLSKFAAVSAAALGVAMAFAVAGAQAQQVRRVVRAEGPNTERITIVDESGRVRTKITVRPRSYLDPGKETLAFDQHYHDYAVPPGGHSYPDTMYQDWRFSNSRMPLPGLWDAPGWVR